MLIIKKHKKLLLNLNDPDRVTTVIPTAKAVEVQGKMLVSVPHRADEVKVLRNLGFDAPAPMSSYYNWPGMFKPYEHQRVSAEFMTMNPRSFNLSGMGCISGDETVRVSRKSKSFETTLRDLHAKFHSMPDKDSWKVRSLKDDRFGMNPLLDSIYKGEQPTLRFTLADGKTFRCTPDHRIARPDGTWTEAGQLIVGDALVTNGKVMLACPTCGVPRPIGKYSVPVTLRKNRSCKKCKASAQVGLFSGNKNPAYKGTDFKDNDGYIRAWMPDHHRADNSGRVYRHILVAEESFGVAVTMEYHVHHINGVKDDNRPENLEVLLASDHHRKHDHRIRLDGTVSAKGGVVVVLPKQSSIVSIEDGGVTDVYDLCMEAPHHNFVVNGVVVHNSGKTMCVLWAFDYLKKLGVAHKMLVVSPLSTLERVWGDEIFKHFPELNFTVLHGTRERRHQLLACDFDIYIINHDGIKSKDTIEQLRNKEGLDVVTVDEIASFRNASTDRWKALNAITKDKDWVWGLTGTPTPNAPTDAWAQIKLISPTRVPKYFGAFRDQVMKPMTKFKWGPREGATEAVKACMQPAIRFAREDCIDLPPTTYVTRSVELSPDQKRAYKQMLTKMHAEVGDGQVTAVNEAAKLTKLLQIVTGVVYTEHGEQVIPCPQRVEVVKEIIEESGSKVIVFVPFTSALTSLAADLSKDFTVEMIHGGVSKAERDRIFGAFQKSKDPRVLVANAGAMSHGLTLTAADTIVWYAPINSLETYEQANARIVRPGQKLNTLIVNIEASDMERKMYARLQHKGRMQGLLLELLKGEK